LYEARMMHWKATESQWIRSVICTIATNVTHSSLKDQPLQGYKITADGGDEGRIEAVLAATGEGDEVHRSPVAIVGVEVRTDIRQ
jgi:hypothetical protein